MGSAFNMLCLRYGRLRQNHNLYQSSSGTDRLEEIDDSLAKLATVSALYYLNSEIFSTVDCPIFKFGLIHCPVKGCFIKMFAYIAAPVRVDYYDKMWTLCMVLQVIKQKILKTISAKIFNDHVLS